MYTCAPNPAPYPPPISAENGPWSLETKPSMLDVEEGQGDSAEEFWSPGAVRGHRAAAIWRPKHTYSTTHLGRWEILAKPLESLKDRST